MNDDTDIDPLIIATALALRAYANGDHELATKQLAEIIQAGRAYEAIQLWTDMYQEHATGIPSALQTHNVARTYVYDKDNGNIADSAHDIANQYGPDVEWANRIIQARIHRDASAYHAAWTEIPNTDSLCLRVALALQMLGGSIRDTPAGYAVLAHRLQENQP